MSFGASEVLFLTVCRHSAPLRIALQRNRLVVASIYAVWDSYKTAFDSANVTVAVTAVHLLHECLRSHPLWAYEQEDALPPSPITLVTS